MFSDHESQVIRRKLHTTENSDTGPFQPEQCYDMQQLLGVKN